MLPSKIFERSKRLSLKAWASLVGIGLIVIILGGLTLATAVPAKVVATEPDLSKENISLTAGITVHFSRPVSRRQLAMSINPAIDGNWEWKNSVLGNHFVQTATFQPDRFWQEGQDYTINIHQTAGPLEFGNQADQVISFKTQTLPQIVGASVSEGQTNISATGSITVFLDQPNDNLINYNFRFEPAVEINVVQSQDQKSYALTPKTSFNQGQEYHLIIDKQIVDASAIKDSAATPNPTDEALNLKFTTQYPPGIESYSPQGNSVLASTSEIKLVFKDAMNQKEVTNNLSISPTLAGSWKWTDDKTIVFTPSGKLTLATTYTIKLASGVHALNNSVTEAEATVVFSTIGQARVSGFSPLNRAAGVAVTTPVRVTFDQDVDHASAESLFSIEPNVAGKISWSGRQMIWQSSTGLANNTSYTATIKVGVKSVNGLDSVQTFATQFTTVEQSVLLNIAWDHQDKALSCEAASLKMALNYKGAQVSEDDIMSIVGYDPTIRSGSTWGDPYQAFVGNINGSQNTTGYGVYWDPIARAARTWRNAEAFSGWTVSQLAGAIAAGNPVVIWGTLGKASVDSWQTPSGRTVQAWKGEHTRTVIGFKGSSDNPTSFTLNDPIVGRISWSTSQLKANWAAFGNSGVVVF